MNKGKLILYQLINKELIEVKRYAPVKENIEKLKIFVYQNNRKLFAEGKYKNERYFFKQNKGETR